MKQCTPCCKKQISKSKCTKHTNAGPLLEVHYINSNSTRLHYNYNYTLLHSTTLHYITLHYTPSHYITLQYTILHYITLRDTILNCTKLHYTYNYKHNYNFASLHYTTPESSCGWGNRCNHCNHSKQKGYGASSDPWENATFFFKALTTPRGIPSVLETCRPKCDLKISDPRVAGDLCLRSYWFLQCILIMFK